MEKIKGLSSGWLPDGTPIRPLVPYKEFYVNILHHKVLVMEFSFKAQRELGGTLSGSDGRAFLPINASPNHKPYILIDADIASGKKAWTLAHERKHVEYYYRNKKGVPPFCFEEEIWDEFFIELLVCRDFPLKLLEDTWCGHIEIILALRKYMRAGPAEEQADKVLAMMRAIVAYSKIEREEKRAKEEIELARATGISKDTIRSEGTSGGTSNAVPEPNLS